MGETPSENGAFRSLGITPLEGPRFRSLRLGYGLPEQRSDMLHGAESPANRNYTAAPTPVHPTCCWRHAPISSLSAFSDALDLRTGVPRYHGRHTAWRGV